MSTNSNFTIAVHILTLIAHHARPLSSSFIAGSVNTNPVTIRKLVGILREENLVRTIPGSTGGTVLAKSPESITLKNVYELFRTETLFGLYPDDPNPQCIVGRNLQYVLLNLFSDAETLLSVFLEKITLADVRDFVIKRDKETE
jgi:DNA-binding IscR family transcriptional regulator